MVRLINGNCPIISFGKDIWRLGADRVVEFRWSTLLQIIKISLKVSLMEGWCKPYTQGIR